MHTHTTGTGIALVAGTFAVTGALAILLRDALTTGVWTIEHGLIPLLMIIQILTGHLAVAAVRQRHLLAAVGFLVVASAATWGVLETSVSKQSSVQAETVAAAEAVNRPLTDKTADLAKARLRLADAERMVDIETGKGGCKSNCRDWKQRAEEVRSHVKVLEGEIAALGPAKPIGAESAKMAELISAVTGHDRQKVAGVLALIKPFTFALIFELAALVSFAFAFPAPSRVPSRTKAGNDNGATVPAGSMRPEPPVPPGSSSVPAGSSNGTDETAEVIDWVREFRARNGRSPRIDELRARFPSVPKTTAWRRCKAA